ncbi:MAG: helix-turn-helix transcriptional regulator [Flavobacteriales bacterium]|nr:helix-turn-helix transcriptional regulator [Flavobacteriales bacterium]
MSFGKRLTEARKKKSLSQQAVAKSLGTMAPVIGRYERDEAKPSIEVAAKLASLLEVSLDYLVGNSDVEVDISTLNRVLQLQQLPQEDKTTVFKLVDAFLRDYKAKQAYS